MRCELAALAMLASCTWEITDLTRPIGVVAQGLTDEDSANLAEAAACWNLQFGSHYVTGADATSQDQQVDVFYNDPTCLVSQAQTQAGLPESVAICPEEHWSGLTGPYGTSVPITPFRVLSHELGHVLNIVGHPDDALAVMQGGGHDFYPMFDAADFRVFAGANPGSTPSTQCHQVIRSFQPGTHIGHCACDLGPFDVMRPIALAPSPEFDEVARAHLATAAACWNLHYGTAIDLQGPGDQTAYLEPRGGSCFGRAQDGNDAVVCTPATVTSLAGAMQDVADALGVDHHCCDDVVFDAADDAHFATVFPAARIRCQQVVVDRSTGRCRCDD